MKNRIEHVDELDEGIVAVDLCKMIDEGPDRDSMISYLGVPGLCTLTVTATSHRDARSRKFELHIRDAASDDVTNAHLVVDLVVRAYRFGKPHVLLVRRRFEPFAGKLALPGGYFREGETAAQAGVRELAEETGVTVAPEMLHEVGVRTAPDRDPRGRVITVALAVALDHMPAPVAGSDAEAVRWCPVAEVPWDDMAFDHASILSEALEKLEKVA